MKRTAAHLGQHFLHSPSAVAAMVDAAHIDEGTTVLEIGPGEGVLTKALLARAGKVVAIEKDSTLAAGLRETFAADIANGKLVLIEDDFRNVNISHVVGMGVVDAVRERSESQTSRTYGYGESGDNTPDKEKRRHAHPYENAEMPADARRGEGGRGDVSENTTTSAQRLRNEAGADIPGFSYVVAANIPYYITGEIIRTLLTATHQPKHIALLIQKEVAERILARNGKESILSLSVKAFGMPRIVKIVPRGAFRPMPAVDSAIIAIENISKDFFDGFSEETFFQVVKSGFAEKRKQLGGNLRSIASTEAIDAACAKCEVLKTTRAEDVPLEQWACLSKHLFT